MLICITTNACKHYMDNNYPNKVYTYLNEKKNYCNINFEWLQTLQNFDFQYLAKSYQFFKIMDKPST